MLPSITRAELEEAAESLKQLLDRYCGGTIEIHYLDGQNFEIEFPL
jgi:DNA/RNA-binding domain of Phe-tRNA-synthetase-like protein